MTDTVVCLGNEMLFSSVVQKPKQKLQAGDKVNLIALDREQNRQNAV